MMILLILKKITSVEKKKMSMMKTKKYLLLKLSEAGKVQKIIVSI